MNVGNEIRIQTENQGKHGTCDMSAARKQSGPRLCALIRPKEIENRWKQYIQILIASIGIKILYSLLNKDSLIIRLYEKLMLVFIL